MSDLTPEHLRLLRSIKLECGDAFPADLVSHLLCEGYLHIMWRSNGRLEVFLTEKGNKAQKEVFLRKPLYVGGRHLAIAKRSSDGGVIGYWMGDDGALRAGTWHANGEPTGSTKLSLGNERTA